MTDVRRYTAFSGETSGGNPAGVVLDARGLDDPAMQAIAAEVGFSETAFLQPHDEPGVMSVRYFSPQAEVDFCGHATIASAVAAAESGETGTLLFRTGAGDVPVSVEDTPDGLMARLTSVPSSVREMDPEALDAVLGALRWSPDDLHPDWPVRLAYAGVHHPILPVASRERLADLDYDFDRLLDLMTAHGWTTVNLVWVESADVVHARNPFPVGGVVEDPATGAAAAAFGGYLRVERPSGDVRNFVIHQGDDMGRPSRLHVSVRPDDPRVTVAGTAVRLDT